MTHDEMIAVIQAHKEGKAIEYRNKDRSNWTVSASPIWNFSEADYRIKSLPVPPGDLTWEEARKLHEEGVKVQFKHPLHSYEDGTGIRGGWATVTCWFENLPYCNMVQEAAYRRAPVPRKVKLGPEDVPPGSALREKGNRTWGMVTGVGDDCVYWCEKPHTFEQLFADECEIKRPGQDWQRCEKDEVTA